MFEDEEYGEESLLVSTKTEYDLEENVLRPKAMSDYVGQQKVKENLGESSSGVQLSFICKYRSGDSGDSFRHRVRQMRRSALKAGCISLGNDTAVLEYHHSVDVSALARFKLGKKIRNTNRTEPAF